MAVFPGVAITGRKEHSMSFPVPMQVQSCMAEFGSSLRSPDIFFQSGPESGSSLMYAGCR